VGMLAKWATGRNILALLIIFLLFDLVIIPVFYPGFPTLDTLPLYTPDEAYRYLSSYGAQGRQQYLLVELTLDLVYPLTTALLFSLLILYSFRRGFADHPWTRWLALIPLAELLVDYLENVCAVVMLLGYPARMAGVAAVASIFTVPKFSLTAPELVFVIGPVAWPVRYLRRRSGSQLAAG